MLFSTPRAKNKQTIFNMRVRFSSKPCTCQVVKKNKYKTRLIKDFVETFCSLIYPISCNKEKVKYLLTHQGIPWLGASCRHWERTD